MPPSKAPGSRLSPHRGIYRWADASARPRCFCARIMPVTVLAYDPVWWRASAIFEDLGELSHTGSATKDISVGAQDDHVRCAAKSRVPSGGNALRTKRDGSSGAVSAYSVEKVHF